MRDLPIAAKVIVNIVLYVLYVLIISIAFSLLFPIVIGLFGGQIPDPDIPQNTELFNKIQYFILLLVLVVSVIARKYFYIGFSRNTTEVVTTTVKTSHTQSNKSQDISEDDEEDEDIKIYVDKEIK